MAVRNEIYIGVGRTTKSSYRIPKAASNCASDQILTRNSASSPGSQVVGTKTYLKLTEEICLKNRRIFTNYRKCKFHLPGFNFSRLATDLKFV